jgi:hypothetical protein
MIKPSDKTETLRSRVASTSPGDLTDQKYLLHHTQLKRWFSICAGSAVGEMDRGMYDDWSGPYDEIAVVTHKREYNLAPRVRQRPPSDYRTAEDLQKQIQRVRETHCRHNGIGIH